MERISGDFRRSHWHQHATSWQHFGPPLRPNPHDMVMVQSLCAAACDASNPPRALLLGVTPEYALLPWSDGTRFTAVDKCPEMIENVWPSQCLPDSFRAVEGDWTALPVDDESIDIAMGDGISTVLPHWSAMDKIMNELSRVCATNSKVILRLFVKPQGPDSLAQLMTDLEVGLVQSFHAFKLRLLMLLQKDLSTGVKPRRAWEVWHELQRQHATCLQACCWSAAVQRTIDAYEHSQDTYWFPTMAEAQRVLSTCFRVAEVKYSDHELADRCPIFVLERSF